MRTRIDYQSGSYGTGTNVSKYLVSVSNSPAGRVHVSLVPDEPAQGRGVGPGKGAVQRHEFVLPARAAEQLAEAILFVASKAAGSAQAEIRIDENSEADL